VGSSASGPARCRLRAAAFRWRMGCVARCGFGPGTRALACGCFVGLHRCRRRPCGAVQQQPGHEVDPQNNGDLQGEGAIHALRRDGRKGAGHRSRRTRRVRAGARYCPAPRAPGDRRPQSASACSPNQRAHPVTTLLGVAPPQPTHPGREHRDGPPRAPTFGLISAQPPRQARRRSSLPGEEGLSDRRSPDRTPKAALRRTAPARRQIPPDAYSGSASTTSVRGAARAPGSGEKYRAPSGAHLAHRCRTCLVTSVAAQQSPSLRDPGAASMRPKRAPFPLPAASHVSDNWRYTCTR
jgi:hypothetical protein